MDGLSHQSHVPQLPQAASQWDYTVRHADVPNNTACSPEAPFHILTEMKMKHKPSRKLKFEIGNCSYESTWVFFIEIVECRTFFLGICNHLLDVLKELSQALWTHNIVWAYIVYQGFMIGVKYCSVAKQSVVLSHVSPRSLMSLLSISLKYLQSFQTLLARQQTSHKDTSCSKLI